MGLYQIIMAPEIIKQSRDQLPPMEIKLLGLWLESHLAKSNQVETLLKVLKTKMKRPPRSKIAKERRIEIIKILSLNS